MHKPTPPVSLADLSAAGIRLRPYEAVTIVRELVLQVARGEVAGFPSSHVIRLSSAGAISVEGPVGAGGPSVARAAQLLDSLLPPSDAGQQFRVPGGLRLVVTRAIGAIDLPPFPSLESFAEALARFAATDPAAAVVNLVVTWAEVAARAPQSDASESAQPGPLAQIEPFVAPRGAEASLPPSELTVSDIRRARRATGMTLAQVARRSRIPLTLLRQLEWGFVLNWPAGLYGRTQLIRYARAAGLDEQLVLSTITPLLLEADARRSALAPGPVRREHLPAVEEPVIEVEIMPVPLATFAADTTRPSRRVSALAALAIPALLAIALLPAWWARTSSRPAEVISEGARVGGAGAERALVSEPLANRQGTPAAAAADPDDSVAAQPVAGQSPAAPAPERFARPGPEGARNSAAGGRPSEGAYRPAVETPGDSTPVASAGTALFYPSDEEGEEGVVPVSGGSRDTVLRITRIVDDAANNSHLRVSPDRRRIAFDSDRDGVRGVYVADADGKNVRRVSGEGTAAVPSWSPDGTKLAFARAEPSRGDVWNLWTLDLGSAELQQITRNGSGHARGASWFPDGRRLAYSDDARLVVRDLGTGSERVFPSPRRGRPLRDPAVSPDGRRIMFHVERDGAWLLDLADGSMRRILEDPSAEEYSWSSDGRRVAYHSRRSGTWGVWVMASR